MCFGQRMHPQPVHIQHTAVGFSLCPNIIYPKDSTRINPLTQLSFFFLSRQTFSMSCMYSFLWACISDWHFMFEITHLSAFTRISLQHSQPNSHASTQNQLRAGRSSTVHTYNLNCSSLKGFRRANPTVIQVKWNEEVVALSYH